MESIPTKQFAIVILCFLAWALNLFDAISTYLLLQNGASEINPVVAWTMGKVGVVEALVVTKLPGLLIITLITFLLGSYKIHNERATSLLLNGMIVLNVIYVFTMIKYNLAWMLPIHK